MMADFQALTVWIKAHQLTLAIYQLAQTFPPEAMLTLTRQIYRVSASIPATIAEGHSCEEKEDFCCFLQLAIASANELQYYLLLARDLTYLKPKDYECFSRTIEDLQQSLTAKIQKLEAKT